ncbi:WhiB family transcriptional regulator [Streptomyces sp. NPDC054775]
MPTLASPSPTPTLRWHAGPTRTCSCTSTARLARTTSPGRPRPDDLARIERARRACSGCPIADGCLKWALANPHLTPSSIWAATTARQRTTLRHRLQIRLGADWVGVVAQTDRARARQARSQAPDPAPPAHPMWTSRYEPRRQPVTPHQQQRNREALDLAQRTTRTPRPAPSAATLEASA